MSSNVSKIVLNKYQHPTGKLIFQLDNVLSHAECDTFINVGEYKKFHKMPTHIPGLPRRLMLQKYAHEAIWWESPVEADIVWSRVKNYVFDNWQGIEEFISNNWVQMYRCKCGITSPYDTYPPFMGRRCYLDTPFLSVLTYLNDNFEGGHTRLRTYLNDIINSDVEYQIQIKPKKGSVVVYQDCYTAGSTEVTRGVKYSMLTHCILDSEWIYEY